MEPCRVMFVEAEEAAEEEERRYNGIHRGILYVVVTFPFP